MADTRYFGTDLPEHGIFSVVFMNGTGRKFEWFFDDEHEAFKFANKIKHSKECILISCPNFS